MTTTTPPLPGRPSKYREPTDTITVRVPKRFKKQIKKAIYEMLEKYR